MLELERAAAGDFLRLASVDRIRIGTAAGKSDGKDKFLRFLLVRKAVSYTHLTITEAGSAARFTNTYTPSQTGSLTVSKQVVGDGADLQKEFTFTAVINGETEIFVLKHGESKTFSDLPVGTTYTITETDCTAQAYVRYLYYRPRPARLLFPACL